MRLREELARRRMSRASLADHAKISLSSLEKPLSGQRPFTDQALVRIETALGPRWIAWREGLVRNDAGGPAEMQSVGRDVTDRTESERALAQARDLADAAMGWAFAATVPEGTTFTTIELKINYLRAVKEGTLSAEARVVKAGFTLGYIECEITDDQARLVAMHFHRF